MRADLSSSDEVRTGEQVGKTSREATHQSKPACCFTLPSTVPCLFLGGAFLEVSCSSKALSRPRKQRRLLLGDGAQQRAVVILDLAVRVCIPTWWVSTRGRGANAGKG